MVTEFLSGVMKSFRNSGDGCMNVINATELINFMLHIYLPQYK